MIARIGGPKSYSDLAAARTFGVSAASSFLLRRSFEGCLGAASVAMARYALVPVENTINGKISDRKSGPTVEEMASEMGLVVARRLRLRVRHVLASRGRLEDIRMVYSKRQPIEQCGRLVRRLGLRASDRAPNGEVLPDTSAAAKLVASLDINVAAICNAEAAAHYGLDVIKSTGVADRRNNFTTFHAYSGGR
ncbi:MAG: hypothetical protein EB832_02565 [Thaumarchaeota archaeon S14]|nr:MAG: hypothetical protein EB832_02565 [Thaumarchaeota archaeon S14]